MLLFAARGDKVSADVGIPEVFQYFQKAAVVHVMLIKVFSIKGKKFKSWNACFYTLVLMMTIDCFAELRRVKKLIDKCCQQMMKRRQFSLGSSRFNI